MNNKSKINNIMENQEKIIHATGTEKLTEKEKFLVNKLLNEYYERIQRQLKNQIFLECNIKEHETTGKISKARKYSVHVKISGTKVFEADYADWDLARAVHKTMNKLMNEIEHKFHSSEQHLKIRKPQQVRKKGR